METIKLELNIANGFPAKVRYHVDSKLLKTIYSAIFDSHFRYDYQLWGQIQIQTIECIEKTQNKALRIFNFKGSSEFSALLSKIKNFQSIEYCNF